MRAEKEREKQEQKSHYINNQFNLQRIVISATNVARRVQPRLTCLNAIELLQHYHARLFSKLLHTFKPNNIFISLSSILT